MARGDFKTATCCECGEEFGYVFKYRDRNLCDKPECLRSYKTRKQGEYRYSETPKRISSTRYNTQCPYHRDTAGLGPKPKVKRESWCTRHDLQHAPTHDFLKQVNAILRGERGLV